MVDPMAVLPYHDPFDDIPSLENFLMFDENPNLGLAVVEPNSFNQTIIQSSNDIAEANDPLADPIIWGNYYPTTATASNSQAGPSEFCGETSRRQEIPQPPQNLEFGNPVQLPIWPVPPVPYSCTCCQVLREIIHTNGIHVTKLEIHGRLGLICHAILETQPYNGDWTTGNQYHMFDFCKKSIECVREFLIQYCEERKQGGYTMLQDPLLVFYEALCVGLNGEDDDLDIDDFLQPSASDLGGVHQMNQQPAGGPGRAEVRLPKSSLAMQLQRERTGKLTVKDLIGYFHIPIEEAAKKLNVCPTVMKKICRKYGLSRWPYRKIRSIERQISERRASLSARDAEERARAQADIESLQQTLASFFSAFTD
ncbi:unnamed protein product [Camellia sinensis]